MDPVAMILKDTKSISYTYDAYVSPSNEYDTISHNNNTYVFLHFPSEVYGHSNTRSELYVNWIKNGNPDFIISRHITNYAPLIDLVDVIEQHKPLQTLLEKYGLLDVFDEAGSTDRNSQRHDVFISDSSIYGFNLDYIKRRSISIYLKYRGWLSFISTGKIDPRWENYTHVVAKYDNLISLSDNHIIQERHCSSFIDVVESLLGDLFILGNNVLLDGQRIIQCRACGKEFVGTYNKNRLFCQDCSAPAVKQKMYRMRKKEAANAQENHP